MPDNELNYVMLDQVSSGGEFPEIDQRVNQALRAVGVLVGMGAVGSTFSLNSGEALAAGNDSIGKDGIDGSGEDASSTDGSDGTNGEASAPGNDGQPSLSGSDGEHGNLKNEGEAGEKSKSGEEGENGEDGKEGTSGEPGNLAQGGSGEGQEGTSSNTANSQDANPEGVMKTGSGSGGLFDPDNYDPNSELVTGDGIRGVKKIDPPTASEETGDPENQPANSNTTAAPSQETPVVVAEPEAKAKPTVQKDVSNEPAQEPTPKQKEAPQAASQDTTQEEAPYVAADDPYAKGIELVVPDTKANEPEANQNGNEIDLVGAAALGLGASALVARGIWLKYHPRKPGEYSL